MKIASRLIGVWAAGFLVVGLAQPALAQTEVSIGYQLLHVPDETFPLGFNVDVSRTTSRGLGIVGEFGWSRDDQNEPGVTGTIKIFHYGAGPRWSWLGARARPFVQVLAGGINADADTNQTDDSDNAFMIKPGGGVFVPVGPRWGIVGQADYFRVFFKEEGDDWWRFVIGVRFGAR